MKGYNNPMDPSYHAELDDSDFLTGEDITKFRMMVWIFNWLVTLGCYGNYYTTCTLACNMIIPRRGHIGIKPIMEAIE